MYYYKEEYRELYSDQRSALYKKRQARRHKPVEKKVKYTGVDETDDLVKQVSALVAVMKSAPEAPGTATPTKK